MALSDYITINYQPVYTRFIHLESDEWIHMIKQFLDKLAEKSVGKMLTDKILTFIRSGYKVHIQNCDFPYNNTVYPKIRYINSRTVLIVVPSIPYFTTIDTIEPGLCEDVDDKFFKNLSMCLQYNPANFKINTNDHKYLISPGKQTGFISLAHELIHCLRFFEGIQLDDLTEEDNTIYGIKDSVLSYSDGINQVYITENKIRQEWEMNPRVSHDCKEVFCMYVHSTHINSDKFTKESFYEHV